MRSLLNSEECGPQYYKFKGKLDQWIYLDFKQWRVFVTHYSLNSNVLMSWVLEGSTNDSEWNRLDRKTEVKKM